MALSLANMSSTSLSCKSCVASTSSLTVRSAPLRLRNARAVVVRASELKDAKTKLQQDRDQYMEIPGEVDRSKVENIEAGNLSNEAAERRADIGKSREPNFTEVQAFDGPAPETINGRLAMLGVTSALAAEFFSGVGIKEQVATAPVPILSSFILISLASYIPIARGFTRKEPFSNSFWNPKAENWNGRLAMVGFAGILVTEALAGKNIPEFYSQLFH